MHKQTCLRVLSPHRAMSGFSIKLVFAVAYRLSNESDRVSAFDTIVEGTKVSTRSLEDQDLWETSSVQ